MKPVLKWAGGKARLAPEIARAFGGRCEGTYYEPFVGSGAVYLHLKARGLVGRAVLSDANAKLVAVHIAVIMLSPKTNLIWTLVTALSTWPGPFAPLGGRWMLIDV